MGWFLFGCGGGLILTTIVRGYIGQVTNNSQYIRLFIAWVLSIIGICLI